jgi:hypothetical protein
MKFKVILGFPGGLDVLLAMERGDVDGVCATAALGRVTRAPP